MIKDTSAIISVRREFYVPDNNYMDPYCQKIWEMENRDLPRTPIKMSIPSIEWTTDWYVLKPEIHKLNFKNNGEGTGTDHSLGKQIFYWDAGYV